MILKFNLRFYSNQSIFLKILYVLQRISTYFISATVFEAMIGQVDVTTKTAHFYVQRNSPFRTVNAVIPFELALLNEGNTLTLPSGIV